MTRRDVGQDRHSREGGNPGTGKGFHLRILCAWTPASAGVTFVALAMLLLTLPSCKRNPIERLVNPLPDGAVPQSSGQYIVYDEELKTGGGLGFIPGGENQFIDLGDKTAPSRTPRAIRYSWNGGDVFNAEFGVLQHLFAGFSLLVSPDFTNFDSTPGKNLSTPGYTQLKFFIRGSLSAETTVRIEGPDDGAGGITPVRIESGTDFTLTSSWQELTMTIPASDFTNVKVFMTVSLQYAQPPRTTSAGGGGVVFLDDIRYVVP